MTTWQRIAGIVLRPGDEWETIAREDASVDELTRRYIVPLSLLAPVATVIGMKFFDRAWDADAGYLVPADQILAAGVTTLLTSIASVFALAGIFVLLAPLYGSSRDYRKALEVATYGAVPVLLAGATLVLPVMALVGLVGLIHSLYVWWLGVRRVLGVKRSHQAEFIGIAMVLLFIASTLAGAAAGALGAL
jgi:hypothetical protein